MDQKFSGRIINLFSRCKFYSLYRKVCQLNDNNNIMIFIVLMFNCNITTIAFAGEKENIIETNYNRERRPFNDLQLSIKNKDNLIWETHEVARITALQCHVNAPYNIFVNKWRGKIIESENRIIHNLYTRNIKNIEGFLTEEDNKITKKLNEYYGKNICMMPDSINEETTIVPYDLKDISNFDINYNNLNLLK